MATTATRKSKSEAKVPAIVKDSDPPKVREAVEKYRNAIAKRTDISDATKEAMVEKYASKMRDQLPAMLTAH